MGKVWVAEHTGLKTEVVVKFMAKDMEAHDDAAERFAREASGAAAVKSPHVAQVFDYGTASDGSPYIVMELLEGRDLADHLAKHGPMAPRDVAALIAQVAKALGKAHQVGIIHRDIKPDNIFLCDSEGGELFVKLLDFGIAKLHHQVMSSATTTGQVVGTPYYMSPEQIVGERDLDPRSDIWSLGVVAFEAMTGKRPFDGMTVGAITLAIHTKKPKITDHLGGAPAALDAWFAKACAHEAKERFPTARDAAQALLDAVGDGPVSSPHLLVRPPQLSVAESDPSISGNLGSARTVTSLSSSFQVPKSTRSRAPGKPLLFGSIGAVVLLGIIAVLALRGGTSEPGKGTTSGSASPPSSAIADPVPSAASSTTAAPSATALTAATVTAPSASADTSKPAAATMAPPVTTKASGATPRPSGTSRKKPVNDDDIK